jgi:ferrochelatase
LAALKELPEDRRDKSHLVFTAHSIPVAMAGTGPYEAQLREACRLVALPFGHSGRSEWQLGFQSRSGPPSQPWLEPDIESILRAIAEKGGSRDLIIVPIGFLHDHMEVIFDLDVEVRDLCEELGLTMVRAATPGLHPRFIRMIRELILERTCPGTERFALGPDGPPPDGRSPKECRPGCCQLATR